jgi:hypothetical protein
VSERGSDSDELAPVRVLGAARALTGLAILVAIAGVIIPTITWAAAAVSWWVDRPAPVRRRRRRRHRAADVRSDARRRPLANREPIAEQVRRRRRGSDEQAQKAVPTGITQRLVVLAAVLALTVTYLLLFGMVASTADRWSWWEIGLVVAALCSRVA